MIKRVLGIFICVVGATLVIFGILGLVKAFENFSSSELTSEGMGYAFGSIVIPLLFSVFGRWAWRRGLKIFRDSKSNE